MATLRVPRPNEEGVPEGKQLISYEAALDVLSRDETFKATVSAMNTLLLAKGIYSAEEYEFQFRQAAERQVRKRLHKR